MRSELSSPQVGRRGRESIQVFMLDTSFYFIFCCLKMIRKGNIAFISQLQLQSLVRGVCQAAFMVWLRAAVPNDSSTATQSCVSQSCRLFLFHDNSLGSVPLFPRLIRGKVQMRLRSLTMWFPSARSGYVLLQDDTPAAIVQHQRPASKMLLRLSVSKSLSQV